MVNNEEEKLRQQSIEMNINMDLGWNDEDSEDEYADRYDENEDQGDMPHDVDVETYFSSNEKDLCYYTFIHKYKNWVQEVKDCCEFFKKKICRSRSYRTNVSRIC